METPKILIAMSNDSLILKVKQVLQEPGYNIMGSSTDGLECLRKARKLKIDLTVIDFNIKSISGHEVSKILLEDAICDVVLIVSNMQEDFIKELKQQEGIIILTKPINRDILLNTVEIMIKSRKRAQNLKEKISGLEEKLEMRKIIERAKGLLMEELKINEENAFKILQKESMNQRKSMKEVAYNIIEQKSKMEDA